MLPTLHDPEHWRNRASEARAQAEQTSSPEVKHQLLKIAEAYEQLATLAKAKKP
jgi:hypothetical protein